VKEIVAARYGFKAVIKHVPDQAFALDEQLYRRLGRRFDAELALWSASDALHMVMISTFKVTAAGLPMLQELSLMPVTGQWIPIEDSLEMQLLELLVRDGRSFIKGLRYNSPSEQALACATLTDVAESPIPLFIATEDTQEGQTVAEVQNLGSVDVPAAWVWRILHGEMPPLPMQSRLSASCARLSGWRTR